MKINLIPQTYVQHTPIKQSKQVQNSVSETATPSFKNWYTSYDVEKYKESFTNNLRERKEEIFNHLDSLSTTTMENGKKGNITDILESFFDDSRECVQIKGLMHKTPRENIQPILETGFDFSKINTTEYGPGMYFSGNETELLIYNGETLCVDYQGRTSRGINLKEYNNLKSALINEVRSYLKLGFSSIENVMAEAEAISTTIVNDYCRQKIVNELGIDAASLPYGNSYFEIFNPDSIKKVYKK